MDDALATALWREPALPSLLLLILAVVLVRAGRRATRAERGTRARHGPAALTAALKHTRPFVMAHRGGAASYPENTLYAFQNAHLRDGFRLLELDVRLSQDGVPVVIHDATLNRTTDGSGLVRKTSFAALHALRVRHPAGEGTQSLAHSAVYSAAYSATACIPALADVLKALPNCTFSIDLKDDSRAAIKATLQTIQQSQAEARVIVGCVGARGAGLIKRLAPQLPSFFTRRAVALLMLTCLLGLTRWYRPPHQSLQIPLRAYGVKLVRPAVIRWARRWHIPVIVWTVNDGNLMHSLFAQGVDGIITDNPQLLRDLHSTLPGSPAETPPA